MKIESFSPRMTDFANKIKKIKVVMQYFFFEKYLMQPDSFVYINATLMLISSALFIKDLGSCFMSPYSYIRNNFPCTIGTPSGCLDGSYNLK